MFDIETRVIRARRAFERAAGKLLILRLERGNLVSDLIGEDGRVRGTDFGPRELIALSGASHNRIMRALRAI